MAGRKGACARSRRRLLAGGRWWHACAPPALTAGGARYDAGMCTAQRVTWRPRPRSTAQHVAQRATSRSARPRPPHLDPLLEQRHRQDEATDAAARDAHLQRAHGLAAVRGLAAQSPGRARWRRGLWRRGKGDDGCQAPAGSVPAGRGAQGRLDLALSNAGSARASRLPPCSCQRHSALRGVSHDARARGRARESHGRR